LSLRRQLRGLLALTGVPQKIMSGTGEITILPTPVKSESDKKDYRVIQLPNGLKALLISDTSYDLEKLDEEEAQVGPDEADGEEEEECKY
jgi:hypothetical protein